MTIVSTSELRAAAQDQGLLRDDPTGDAWWDEPVELEDCDCDKLPTYDMDGGYYDGVCKKCEARMTEAGYDKYARGWIG